MCVQKNTPQQADLALVRGGMRGVGMRDISRILFLNEQDIAWGGGGRLRAYTDFITPMGTPSVPKAPGKNESNRPI